MQALESPTMRAQTVHATGTLIKWDPKRGHGLIADGERVYFAHYGAWQFMDKCLTCFDLHRCRIKQGTEVEFTFTPDAAHKGAFPPANEIRIKERH
jgi:hypothetical protein